MHGVSKNGKCLLFRYIFTLTMTNCTKIPEYAHMLCCSLWIWNQCLWFVNHSLPVSF